MKRSFNGFTPVNTIIFHSFLQIRFPVSIHVFADITPPAICLLSIDIDRVILPVTL